MIPRCETHRRTYHQAAIAQLSGGKLLKLAAGYSGKVALLPAIAFLLMLLAVGCGGGAALTISAAASLGEALEEIAAEFERLEGVGVDLNLGGSNVLARQVELGAPVDLVILAGSGPVEAEKCTRVCPGANF